jgi:hypothetical protein
MHIHLHFAYEGLSATKAMMSSCNTKLKYLLLSWVQVAHACNPSYSGGRDQEDNGLKPDGANSFRDPIWKTHHDKKSWWSGSRCRH